MHEPYWLIAVKVLSPVIVAFAVAWGTVTARMTAIEADLMRIEAKVEWIMRYMVERQ